MTTTFQRARRPEHKQQRALAILDAARELALERDVRSVTLTDIANRVGIHKSAVLRYFETREEIYLQLTAEEWRGWAMAMREAGSDDLSEAIAATLSARPLFCELLLHAPLNLERHVSVDAVRNFKLVALAALDDLVTLFAEALAIRKTDARDLIAAVTAIAASLWQTAHPAPAVAELYAQDPALAHAVVDFAPRLERLSRVLIRGMQA